MCGRFAAALDHGRLAQRFHALASPGLPGPSWNVTPGQSVALLAQDVHGVRHLAPARWSYIPPWSPTDRLGYRTFNARVESALTTRTYADAARSRRAVIPATGYYEWDAQHHPYYFHPTWADRAGDDVLLIAGLYSWWRADAHSPWVLTATILTTQAQGAPAGVHSRMPVLVPSELVDEWLDPNVPGERILPRVAEAGARESTALLMHRVRPLRGDGPELTVPDAISA